MVNATVCTIGDEILIGQIVDTNSSMIAQKLNSIGVRVVSMRSCSDSEHDILSTLTSSLQSSEIVIVTGGLGPTKDDITKPVLAKLSNSTKFKQSKEQLKIIKQILKKRGIEMLDINKAQAMVPQKCKVIINKVGTAPIMQFEFPRNRFGRNNLLFSMPGVPFETANALDRVIEAIKEHYKLDNIVHKTISTFGIPESTLSKMIEEWENKLTTNHIHLAYLPNPVLGVRLRLSMYGVSKDKAIKLINREIKNLRKILGNHIYSTQEQTPCETVGQLLLNKNATISTAESCTGGLIAHLFTSTPGASKYFWGSVVSYDNSVKQNTLGVQSAVLENHGAVSEQCVKQMAEGVRKKLKTTYSIATSGIAGPSGGTPGKPVGTVCIAVSGPKGTKTISLSTKGTRETNIKRFASNAIDFFRCSLLNDEI